MTELTKERIREIVRDEMRIETDRKNREPYSKPYNSSLRKHLKTVPKQES